MKSYRWVEGTILTLFSVQILTAFLIYSSLPEMMPTHWNIRGEVDGYMTKLWGLSFHIMLNIGLYFFLIAASFIDPKGKMAQFRTTYNQIRLALHMLLFIIFFIFIANGIGYKISVDRTMPALISLLIIYLGNFMGKVQPNYFVGIRTPWTLEDPVVWKKTHRISGPVWIAAGVIGLIGSWHGGVWAFVFFSGAIFIACVFSVWYSWHCYKAVRHNQ